MATNPHGRDTRRKPGRPLKSDANSPAEIKRAALAIFAREGFRAASIVEIAKSAGVAKPLVHYHFASKDELWRAAVGEAFAAMRKEVLALAQGVAAEPNGPSMANIARQMVRFAARHPDLTRIVMDETGRGGERADWLSAAFLAPMFALTTDLVSQIPGNWDPAHVIPIVFGAMNFAFLDARSLYNVYGVDVFDDAYIERHGEILALILTRGMGDANVAAGPTG